MTYGTYQTVGGQAVTTYVVTTPGGSILTPSGQQVFRL